MSLTLQEVRLLLDNAVAPLIKQAKEAEERAAEYQAKVDELSAQLRDQAAQERERSYRLGIATSLLAHQLDSHQLDLSASGGGDVLLQRAMTRSLEAAELLIAADRMRRHS